MSNPTTPFGWQMPTNTDLVTDLPADFEVFGQAVATSMADLLGGTTGQILAKNSNTDMDFVWIANDQGDITGVTATTPLTGGGTSGAITVGIQAASTTQSGAVQLSDSTSTTSSVLAATPTAVKSSYDLAAAAIPKSIVDAKGDLIAGTANDTVSRLAVGTNGQVLVADSTAATGMKWATASGGGKVLQVVSATISTSANITSTSYTDTNITATITPTVNTSKILVLITAQYLSYKSAGSTVNYVQSQAQLLRGATVLFENTLATQLEGAAYSMSVGGSGAYSYLDSPATTSATTYKLQALRGSTATGIYYQSPSPTNYSTITLLEIGA